MDEQDQPLRALNGAIRELVRNSADLAEAALANAKMLGDLEEDRETFGVPAEILELAREQAHACNVSLIEYLTEAILAYAGADQDNDPLRARLLKAKRDAARLREETDAVRAENTLARAQTQRLRDERQRRRES